MTALPPMFAYTLIVILWVLQIGILLVGAQVIRDWVRDGVHLYDYGMIVSLVALILLGVMVFILITCRIAGNIS